jgi:phage protein U
MSTPFGNLSRPRRVAPTLKNPGRSRRVNPTLGKFLVVVLDGPGSYVFDYFPTEIRTNSRANWSAQDTIHGVKPLQYANREPKRINVDDLWLDGTLKNRSIRQDIQELLSLQEETERGTPPILGVVYGDYQQRVVLEEIDIRETLFLRPGEPSRALVSLTLIEVQAEDSRKPRLLRREGA